MPATLRQIAERAGVDVSTVSRVLSGKARQFRIAGSTARRIEATARALGFRPNLNALALRTQRSRVLGVLVSDLGNPFFAAVAGAIEQEVALEGYSLMVASSAESPERQDRYLDVFRARQIDGVVVAPAPGSKPQGALSAFVSDGKPLVQVDRLVPSLRAPAVVVDNQGGASALVEALVQTGRRRIGWVAGSQEAWTMKERTAGFRKAVRSAGLRGLSSLERFGGFDATSGREAAASLLRAPEPPDAIVAANNLLLQGVLEQVTAAGVAHDAIALGGFDGLPLLDIVPHPVFVVEQPAVELGRHAARRLLDVLENRPTAATERVVLPLVLRAMGLGRGRTAGSR